MAALTDDELISLRRFLVLAINGPCIPEWEFEPLIGCTRSDAHVLIAAGLAHEDGLESVLDYVVALLSSLSGSAQLISSRARSRSKSLDLPALHALLAKLLGSEQQPERASAITLRGSTDARAGGPRTAPRAPRVRAARVAKKRGA